MTRPALTVAEAHAILIADEVLPFSDVARLPAWAVLVESASDRVAAFEGARKEVNHTATDPSQYPGSNAPDFQTLAVEAAAARIPPAPEAEVQALRTGIETILKAFGTPAAEWAQQFRALLDRLPAAKAKR